MCVGVWDGQEFFVSHSLGSLFRPQLSRGTRGPNPIAVTIRNLASLGAHPLGKSDLC